MEKHIMRVKTHFLCTLLAGSSLTSYTPKLVAQFETNRFGNPAVGWARLNGECWNVQMSGATAYVASSPGGLKIVDVSNPLEPRIISDAIGDGIHDLRVAGTMVFAAGMDQGLKIYNVTNPQHVTEVANLVTGGLVTGVEKAGNLVYLSDTQVGLRVIDVTNPQWPVEIGSLNLKCEASGLSVAGSVAYLADGNAGIRVIDIADPTKPALLSTLDTPGFAAGVSVIGTTAYVADHKGGLRILDVAVGTHPVEIGTWESNGSLWGGWGTIEKVRVVGTLAFVACGWAGMRIVDVSDSRSPKEAAALDAWNVQMGVGEFSCVGVDVSGTMVLMAGGALDRVWLRTAVYNRPTLFPTVVKEPGSTRGYIGGDLVLSCELDGSPAVSTHWEAIPPGALEWARLSDNELIQGANSEEVKLRSLTLAQDGLRMRCVGVSQLGSVTSRVATVSVRPTPYRVAVSTIGSGSVTIYTNRSPMVTTTGGSYFIDPSNIVDFVAVPSGAHGFLGWSGPTGGAESIQTVIATNDLRVSARFGPLFIRTNLLVPERRESSLRKAYGPTAYVVGDTIPFGSGGCSYTSAGITSYPLAGGTPFWSVYRQGDMVGCGEPSFSHSWWSVEQVAYDGDAFFVTLQNRTRFSAPPSTSINRTRSESYMSSDGRDWFPPNRTSRGQGLLYVGPSNGPQVRLGLDGRVHYRQMPNTDWTDSGLGIRSDVAFSSGAFWVAGWDLVAFSVDAKNWVRLKAPNLTSAFRVAAGSNQVCVLSADGKAWVPGGRGDLVDSGIPEPLVRVTSLDGRVVAAIGSGGSYLLSSPTHQVALDQKLYRVKHGESSVNLRIRRSGDLATPVRLKARWVRRDTMDVDAPNSDRVLNMPPGFASGTINIPIPESLGRPEGFRAVVQLLSDDPNVAISADSMASVVRISADDSTISDPMSWSSVYFGNSSWEAIWRDDPDGDGLNNLQEFLFGRDPLTKDGPVFAFRMVPGISSSRLFEVTWSERVDRIGGIKPMSWSPDFPSLPEHGSTLLPTLVEEAGLWRRMKVEAPADAASGFLNMRFSR